MKTKTKYGIVLLALMSLGLVGHAAVIVSYDASATLKDPTSQGWTLSGTYETPPSAGQETIGDVTYDYWDISNPSPAPTAYSAVYRQNMIAENFSDPTGWTATVDVRISLAASVRNGAWFQVSDGQSSWEIGFVTAGGTSINYINSSGSLVPISDFNISADYFTLQLYYDATASEVTYFLNGIQIGDAVARSGVPTAAANQLYMRWGDNAASPNRTISHWNSVAFETGYAVIPEPGSSLLLGLGLFWLLSLRPKGTRQITLS